MISAHFLCWLDKRRSGTCAQEKGATDPLNSTGTTGDCGTAPKACFCSPLVDDAYGESDDVRYAGQKQLGLADCCASGGSSRRRCCLPPPPARPFLPTLITHMHDIFRKSLWHTQQYNTSLVQHCKLWATASAISSSERFCYATLHTCAVR